MLSTEHENLFIRFLLEPLVHHILLVSLFLIGFLSCLLANNLGKALMLKIT